jgi:hypothetical protein
MSDNAAAPSSNSDFDFKLYRYTPSLPAAIVAVVVFFTLTCLHIWRLTRTRAFYFIAFSVGGACKMPPSSSSMPCPNLTYLSS